MYTSTGARRRGPDARTRLKRLLPSRIVTYWRAFRKLKPRERSVYVALELRRIAGVPQDRWRRPRPVFVRSILFLCHGNIIRSPMAATLMRRRLSNGRPEVSIVSAGLHAETGHFADARARRVAREFGVSLDDHQAQRLTEEHVRQADMILTMDALNHAELLGRYPEAEGKGFMLGSWLDGRRTALSEICDPYDGDHVDVRRCYEVLDSAIQNLAADLSSNHHPEVCA